MNDQEQVATDEAGTSEEQVDFRSPAEIAATTSDPCSWHRGDQPVDEGVGCQSGCGMYAVDDCRGCGLTFLDWSVRGHDDVIVGPYATTSGDLHCTKCGPRLDREAEEAIDDDVDNFGPDPELYPAPETMPTDAPTQSDSSTATPTPVFTSRTDLINRAREARAGIIQYFSDVFQWNRHVRKPEETLLEPDPDHALRKIVTGIDEMLAREAIADMPPEYKDWMDRYVARLKELCGSQRFAEANFIAGHISAGVVDIDLQYPAELAADDEYSYWS